MRTSMVAALAIAAALSVSAAQSSSSGAQKTPPDRKPTNKNLTLVGCVQAADDATDRFTLADDKDQTDTTYRLTGTSMKKYLGQRVEIVGGVVPPRLVIKGGLLPSPNVAGQAGAIDPSRAAIAGGAGGTASGTGNPTLPEFRVRTVRPVPGDCKPSAK